MNRKVEINTAVRRLKSESGNWGGREVSSDGSTTGTQHHLEQVAEATLSTFDKIVQKADQALKEGQSLTSGAFGSINTFTSEAAQRNQDRINRANQDSYRHLKTEPAIARVVIEEENGQKSAYYFCRCDQGMPKDGVVSYRAPIGRLAALNIGDAYTLPNGKMVDVVEQATFRPVVTAEGWDALNTVIEAENFGPTTIESLRKLLTDIAGEAAAEDILEQLLAEDSAKVNIHEGIRRTVISKMALRDQPILDKFQDEIFRLPLNQRLLILGPPGTGKTTTLIRRLGQKLHAVYLEDDEQRLVDFISQAQGPDHANSWLMFTPTELLKQYLKEAFGREGVPAPDQQIKTWFDYRRELARNKFSILRTSTGSGTFVLKDDLPSLMEDALARPITWFEEFNVTQRKTYLQELHDAATQLGESQLTDAKDLGERLKDILQQGEQDMAAVFASLAREIPNVQALVGRLRDDTEKKIKGVLNLQLNSNRSFLDELARFLDSLQQAQTGDTDEDDLDAEDDEETAAASTPRTKATAAFNSAVKAQARAAVGRRAPGKASRAGRVLEWLGERSMMETDRPSVGASLLIQAAARRFQNPVRRYIGDIPKRYRSFRRERQQAGEWYRGESFEARDLHPLELDVILLSILRSAGDLASRPSVQREIESPAWSSLQPIMGLYRNQILVDEATDFSPIQLACMAAMAHPRLRSFFACGDFNQRLTTWGARSEGEIEWIFGDIQIKSVTVAYRQSRQLNDLAHAIIRAVDGTEQDAALPNAVDSDGIAPVLLEHAASGDVVEWLADRIRGIDRFYDQLPSIAVFVNSEDEVGPMADALNAYLVEDNIRVEACREGKTVGQENDVRVFHIEHIKGLEFEAVFFVGVDQLAEIHRDLFDKYLYVGATRAATYLGITCQGALPEKIEVLRPYFGTDSANA